MAKLHAVRRRESRQAAEHSGTSASASLPRDLLDKAGQRLGIAGLAYAITYALAYGSGRVSDLLGPTVEMVPVGAGGRPYASDAIAAVCIVLGVAVFVLARRRLIDSARLLDLGLVFEVVAAAGIDAHLVLGDWPSDVVVSGISWVCVWIVFFPLIVPSTPWKTTLAALAAASTTPLLYAIAVGGGAPPLPNAVILSFTIPNYICVVLAVLGSRVLHRMHSDIRRARELGSYRLVEKLGAGGMGEVWRAEHRLLARPAAIKLVRHGIGSDGSAQGSDARRFEREVQATAQLRSPHTVEVYDYGLTEDGTFYYVMELLDGLNLEQLVVEHGPLPAERVAHVLTHMCHSLAEAHEQGLVHRDIKPANVFLCRYGREYDFVKVLDFGLVKRTDRGGEVRVTAVGAFAGTPAYVSPEAALGDAEHVGARSDVYSMGCVAFWLLTGRTVFRATNTMHMLVQQVNEEAPAPSSVTELEIPAPIDALVLRCLRKRPDDRPASVLEVQDALAGLPFPQAWTQERARRWWERHRPAPRPPTPLAGSESGSALPVVPV